jgi:adenosylcobinamide kinase / adenosylcobinamide-phosphate guanylyltransferase
MKILILGGARSGKSAYAEHQALTDNPIGDGIREQAGADLASTNFWYVATATVGDDSEMYQRIEHHQANRDKRWQLIEAPLDIAGVIHTHNTPQDCILIDCLTLWLTNALLEGSWTTRKKEFLAAVKVSQAKLYFVSNEVGSGIVPLGELSRQFVDESGWLHQTLATYCDRVTLVVAGLPLALK